jgi:hypothetical protein
VDADSKNAQLGQKNNLAIDFPHYRPMGSKLAQAISI